MPRNHKTKTKGPLTVTIPSGMLQAKYVLGSDFDWSFGLLGLHVLFDLQLT